MPRNYGMLDGRSRYYTINTRMSQSWKGMKEKDAEGQIFTCNNRNKCKVRHKMNPSRNPDSRRKYGFNCCELAYGKLFEHLPYRQRERVLSGKSGRCCWKRDYRMVKI